MLFKKLIRTFFKYKAQFISMIIMVVLGIGIFAGFNAEWYSIEKDTTSFYNETNLADYRIYNEKKSFSEDDLNNVLSIDGIDKATRYICIDTSESKEDDIIKLAISENFTVSNFKLMEGNPYNKQNSNGVWLSQKYALNNNYKVGDQITIKYGSVTKTLNIEGICLSSEFLINTHGTALMPDYNKVGYAYSTPAFYEKLSNELFNLKYYPQINIISSLSLDEVSTKVDEKLNSTLQIVSKDDVTSYSQAQGELEEGKTIAFILPSIFLLIAILTMITTMNRITTNEKMQIGILKALGFKNKKIINHYTSYAFVIGLVGAIIGLGLGYIVANIFFSPSGSMGTYFEMPDWTIHMPWFTYVGIILIVLLLTLIGYLSVKQQLKGSAAEALRPYEPKKMKSMLIEKTTAIKELSSSGIYICERMAEDLNLKVGDNCKFSLYGQSTKYEVKVEKIISSSTKGFTLTYDLADELNLPYKIDTIYTSTLKSQITTDNEIVSLSSKEDLIKTFDTFMEIMNLMIYVLVLFSSLLAFVVLYNLGTMSYIERYRELATLKVLGFKNNKIRWILTSQNIFTTLIGIIIGCPIGYVTLVGLYKALVSEYELSVVCSWYVYFISIIITFLVSLIVSYFTSLKVKKD